MSKHIALYVCEHNYYHVFVQTTTTLYNIHRKQNEHVYLGPGNICEIQPLPLQAIKSNLARYSLMGTASFSHSLPCSSVIANHILFVPCLKDYVSLTCVDGSW